MITIPDEPAAKRPREDNEDSEVTENVSISSDSVHSVEMSSDSDDESIIESVELQSNPNIDDGAILEPVVEQDMNSRDSGIHNEPTQVYVNLEPQIVSDEPVDDGDDNLDLTQEKNNSAIHDQPTQVYPMITVEDYEIQDNVIIIAENTDDAEVEKIMDTTDLEQDIHEAKTQLHQNSDTLDGKSPSMEVAYDDCPKGTEKVTVLEKMDDENLPSTNDTDDIQITCGQQVKNSQDTEAEKIKDNETVEEIQKDLTPKINGIAKSTDNEEAAKDNEVDSSKVAPNTKAVTVEDMLADFVDEVVEE